MDKAEDELSQDEGLLVPKLDLDEESSHDSEDLYERRITRSRRSGCRRIKKKRKSLLNAKDNMKEETLTNTREVEADTAVLTDIEEDECIPNGSKSIECFICGCRLSKIYNLRIHMKSHVDGESYDKEAFENSEIFNILNPHKRNIDSNIIRNFIIQEIKEKRYSQFYCILNEAAVELHISDSETDSDGATDLIPHNNYRCELCKKNFDRRYKALFHQKTAHNKTEFAVECDYCLKKFVCMNLLIYHLKTQCESDEKPVPCTERFMKFLLKANLDYYASLAQAREQKKLRKMTEAPKQYTCSTCNKTFTRQEHLTRHSAVHLPDEMKFECPICDRRFNRKDNMRSHMKTHTEEGSRSAESRKILCAYCGRSFSSKSNYVVHMRRHTGEKPYKCEVCGKGFPKSTDLNSHKITHTGEKNFVCTICNKAFARSAVLSKHMRIHNGPYSCNFCKKTFTKPSALTLHLRLHTGGRLCVCVACNKAFDTKTELDAHFTLAGHDNTSKPVVTTPEPAVVERNEKSVEADPPANSTPLEQVIDNLKSSSDPLEIGEEEWRTTKVKVPVNEVIQSVLQRSTNATSTEGATVLEEVQRTQESGEMENGSVMAPYTRMDTTFEDDISYNDW